MDVEKRLRLVCNFCNAILQSKKEATKDAFIRHLEESHNIVQNADDVFILPTLNAYPSTPWDPKGLSLTPLDRESE